MRKTVWEELLHLQHHLHLKYLHYNNHHLSYHLSSLSVYLIPTSNLTFEIKSEIYYCIRSLIRTTASAAETSFVWTEVDCKTSFVWIEVIIIIISFVWFEVCSIWFILGVSHLVSHLVSLLVCLVCRQ